MCSRSNELKERRVETESALAFGGDHDDGSGHLLIREKIGNGPEPEYFPEFGWPVNTFGKQCQSLQNIGLARIRLTDEEIHPFRIEVRLTNRFEILNFYLCEHELSAKGRSLITPSFLAQPSSPSIHLVATHRRCRSRWLPPWPLKFSSAGRRIPYRRLPE